VVTEDVPEGALAVARARQANVEGYSARRAREAADAAAAKAGTSGDGRDD
jgi:bifunctional UDP-N-acetylglucosamine pyrophosphorylase / glucosamine-1-phosphate N-acetyltransferase